VIRALAGAAALLTVAHFPVLTACLVPAAAVFAATQAALAVHLIRRGRTAR
jgi:hypothetical protein